MAPSRDSGAPLSALRLLYLLATLLHTGFAKSQANFTEHLFNVTGLTNHTVVNGTTINVTLLADELSHIEEEHNATVVTEDEEGFQDWENELQPGKCHEQLLSELSLYCGNEFYMTMMNVSEEKWCSMEEVIRPYNEVTLCLERWSTAVGCFFPNPIVQDLFLQIHTHFFQTCSRDHPDFTDPPMALVLTLTLLPVSLIPALVYMALRKNQAYK
uniref:Receptor activity modifying protein 3 n=1 Tax=Neogobius melanostomus TaxID=47308 RepID=A0A8C6SMG4_9GOBI